MLKRNVEKHHDLIYDVGMHRGEDTDLYLRKGFKVIGFEADPDLVQHCRERFAEEVACGQLVIVEGAVVDDVSQPRITFHKNDVFTEWGTVDADWKARNERMGWNSETVTIEVDVIDFRACLERYGMPHYLKIDIEGSDLTCLERLGDYDVAPDYVSIESDQQSLEGIEREMDLLEQAGFTSYKVVQQATVDQQRLPVPSREGKDIEYRIPQGASGMFGSDLPGAWVPRSAALRTYARIMWAYRVFGSDGLVRRIPVFRRMWDSMQQRMGRSVPGWYDTHARHGSVTD